MKYAQVIKAIADSLFEIDSMRPTHKAFRPGIGPFGEPQIVRLLAKQLVSHGLTATTQLTPDLAIRPEWAIEVKIVRPFGDNGKQAENWSVNMLHPYPGNVSLIGDALKLSALDSYTCRGVLMLGYEHHPARISLDPLLVAFELITKHVGIALGPRIEETRTDLCHPEHQVLRCVGWQIAA